MENQEERLVFLSIDLLLRVGLMLAQEFWMQADITGLVNSVNISKACSNGEVRRNRAKRLVHVVDILRLGIKGTVVNSSVIDTILLSSGNTDFLLNKLACHWYN